jgi:hypothetical protein
MNASQTFIDVLRSGEFAQHLDSLISPLLSADNNTFAHQETTYFDYKDSFPFSNSDDYFEAIVRLVCAFNNTYGGFIIFGVHDKNHTGGHNKVSVNIERFNNRLRTSLNNSVICKHHHAETPAGDIDIVMVPKRPMGVPLTRISNPIADKNRVNRIWLRRGHEVLRAESKDIPFLYANRDDFGDQERYARSSTVAHALPPSPATLHQFIGRIDVLDALFSWLIHSEDPRCFLHGSGGFGKSTIAYQFANIVANSGAELSIFGDKRIDRVLFLSAKEKYLDTIAGTTREFLGTDFTNSDELFRGILQLSGWTTSITTLEALNSKQLANELAALLNIECQLIVIDDVDTLTAHRRRDAGMDTLYRILSRSSSGSKVLYTQRNLPIQSIESSIEIGAFQIEDYNAFVVACADQFKVPTPSDELRDIDIRAASESRPLAIEIIIGLRRRCGDYRKALELWRKEGGIEAREYLFEREYNALPGDNRARHLLAALTLLGRPATFGDLQNILMFGDQQLSDAIAVIRDMFLVLGETTTGDTVFQLGEATKAYVNETSAKLDKISAIRERIRHYQSQSTKKPHIVVEIEARCERHLQNGNYHLAWAAVTDPKLNESLREHPAFLALVGRVAAQTDPVKLTEAREAFDRAHSLGYRDSDMMENWFRLEENAGFALSEGAKVCRFVCTGKYPPSTKARFYQLEGGALYYAGRSELYLSPMDALKHLGEATATNLTAFETIFPTDERDIERYEEYARNAAYFYFQSVLKYADPILALEFVANLRDRTGPLDPLEGPIVWLAEQLQRILSRAPDTPIEGALKRILGYARDAKFYKFHVPDLRDRALGAYRLIVDQRQHGTTKGRAQSP